MPPLDVQVNAKRPDRIDPEPSILTQSNESFTFQWTAPYGYEYPIMYEVYLCDVTSGACTESATACARAARRREYV